MKNSKETIDYKKIELVFGAHLAEYETLRNEINQRSQLQNQLTNYAIAIVAGTVTLLAIGQPSIGVQQPFLFLVSSMMLSALSWSIIELNMIIHQIASYVQNVLSLKLQNLIGFDSSPDYTVLKWDAVLGSFFVNNILYGIVWSGKILITVIPGILFVILFYSIRSTNTLPWTISEIVMFALAIAMQLILFFSILANMYTRLAIARTQPTGKSYRKKGKTK